jgi:hypothetical protein
MRKVNQKVVIPILLLLTFIALPILPVVKAEDLSLSTINANPLTVHSLKNSTITVTAQGTGGLVEGASVGIHVEGGVFASGTNIHNDTSDSNGEVVVDWKAPVVDATTQYNFTATIRTTDGNVTQIQTSVDVLALDISSSSVGVNPDEINETEQTQITVIVDGAGGLIEGATVQIIGVGGVFDSSGDDNSTGLSDVNGVYSDFWTAPEVADPTIYTFVATVTYIGSIVNEVEEKNVTVNPVEGQIILSFAVTPGYSLEVGQTATITVTATDNTTALPVEDVIIYFVAIDGNFTESGFDTYNENTSALGQVVAHWETDTLTPAILGTDYDIDITAAKIGLLTNYTTLEFHVTEHVGILAVETDSAETAITLGDTVDITVSITIDASAYEGALVEIVALSGEFTQTGNDTYIGYTDSQGEVTVTWDTTNMVMVGPDPVNYTFSITVDIFPHHLDQESSYEILVSPTATSPPGGGPDEPFYLQWWFFVAAGGAIVVIGAIIIFARKR